MFDCKYVFIFYGKIECWLLFFVESLFCRLLCTIWVVESFFCSASFMMSIVFLFFQAIQWLRTKRVHILSHLMVKCFNKKAFWIPKSFNSWKCQTDTDEKWTPLVEMMSFVTVGRHRNIMDVSNACFINVTGSKLFGFVETNCVNLLHFF